jgi:hypothetical protein
VYHGDSKPLIKESLDNRDQELIAEKYLRDKFDGFTIDVPRGGRLEDIDVLGTANDEENGEPVTVIASVTSSPGKRRRPRVKTLNSYSDRDKVCFFDAEESRPEGLHEDVEYVSCTDGTKVLDVPSENVFFVEFAVYRSPYKRGETSPVVKGVLPFLFLGRRNSDVELDFIMRSVGHADGY